MPASMGRSMPLMKLAEGLERKTMASATSSGVAARFSGVMVVMACPMNALPLTQSCTTAISGFSYHVGKEHYSITGCLDLHASAELGEAVRQPIRAVYKLSTLIFFLGRQRQEVAGW